MSSPLRLVLLTGLSGAGKSRALQFMEDLDYYCVDNLPAPLLPTFVDLLQRATPGQGRAAVCVDSRSGDQLDELPAYLDEAAERGARFETVFLECADDILVQRYSESRRRHPAGGGLSVQEAIAQERERLGAIRGRSDLVIDTSETSLPELRIRLTDLFGPMAADDAMNVTIVSFGFKHGLPKEADLVFDVRFLPNPFYVRDLRDRTGEDPAVRAFVFESGVAESFLHEIRSLFTLILPRYAAEPKSYLTIAVGCTGGQHRSVAIAEDLAGIVRELGYQARVRHRELAAPRRT